MTEHLHEALSQHDAPARPPRRRGRRRLGALAILVVLVLIVAAGVLGVTRIAHHLFSHPADYSGTGTGSVVVQVHTGDSLSAIGQELLDKHVVESVGAFTDATNNNPRATSIQPGFYRLHEHMQASLALALMLDPSSLLQSQVTIPEGRRVRDILPAIAAATHIKLSDLKQAAKDPAALGVPSWGASHGLEGFLFPATYTFAPHTTAKQALAEMVTKFNQVAASVDLVGKAQQLGYSPYQVLTLASIVQREGRLDQDFPKIAEVFYNRLKQQMPLQSDATLFYVLPANHGPLTQSDLQLQSPYNTRINPGLPPTPIASPGELAMRAALNPPQGNLLYFVTIDKAGHTGFASTFSQFQHLVAESQANGVQ